MPLYYISRHSKNGTDKRKLSTSGKRFLPQGLPPGKYKCVNEHEADSFLKANQNSIRYYFFKTLASELMSY